MARPYYFTDIAYSNVLLAPSILRHAQHMTSAEQI